MKLNSYLLSADNSSDINSDGYLDLTTHGFVRYHLPKDLLSPIADNIQSALTNVVFDQNIVESGYSQIITHLLRPRDLQLFMSFGERLKNQLNLHKYLFLPKVIDVRATYSFYNSCAVNNPTHAHLWHRDGDDFLEQIKIMIPLGDCSELNGRFSVLSKTESPWSIQFQDGLLSESLSESNNTYRVSDSYSRITDRVFRSYFNKEKIFDFDSTLGDILVVDTNSCWHKGGLVTDPSQSRILIQITIGSFTNFLHKDLNLLRKISRQACNYFSKRATNKGIIQKII
jgi:hypothetical protein